MATNEHDNTSLQFLSGSCGLSNNSKRMLILLDSLEGLTNFQKETLKNRYITLTEDFSGRSQFFSVIFHGGRSIVTVGSLIVPALLSIQNNSYSPQTTLAIYWTTWVLSLLVTICNGVLTLFKIDKKYYFLHSVLEHLQSEIWQYIYLTGKYEGRISSHQNQYGHFCSVMEKLKIKQVQEEYYKVSDDSKDRKTPKGDANGLSEPLLNTLVDGTEEGADENAAKKTDS